MRREDGESERDGGRKEGWMERCKQLIWGEMCQRRGGIRKEEA